jgi:hypothetical protein
MYALILIISTLGPANAGNQLNTMQIGHFKDAKTCEVSAAKYTDADFKKFRFGQVTKFDSMFQLLCVQTQE